MRSTPDQTARNRILADLGIDVWRLRKGAVPAAADVADSAAAASGEQLAQVRGPAAAAPAAAAAAPAAPAVPARRPDSAGAARRPESSSVARPAAAAAARFSVFSYSAGGITLLLARPPTGRESRLVRDLFAAVTGRWDLDPAAREFDWPPQVAVPGMHGEGAAERALRAFVDKELADHGSTLVLVDEALADRVGRLQRRAEPIVVPDLDRLGRDSAQKRRLWADLGRHLLEVRSGGAGSTGAAARAPDGMPDTSA